MISFLLAADADEFLTIAKFRALRKLWARVEEACGLAPKPAYVAAETAWRMMTQRDPYVNMLRTTIAVTAAGVGGADASPRCRITAALGLPDAFARRVARNTQLILLEESNLWRVADPAAGSGGIEDADRQALRRRLGAVSGDRSRRRRRGGARTGPDAEEGRRHARRARRRRSRGARTRSPAPATIPISTRAPVKVLDVPRRQRAPTARPPSPFEPLPRIRLAEPFEALRDASDRMLAKTGARPKVFLANLGKLSDFTARATFAKNFYEAGGIEALEQ